MAKQQVWYLARDDTGDTNPVILSRYKLRNCAQQPHVDKNWITNKPSGEDCIIIELRDWNLLTGGKYKLRPGDEPRKVVFTPLGVKDVK